MPRFTSLCGVNMATGGVDPDLDHRRTCSICLESFRGRHPKLLPCFHTFCLSCLRQLTGEDTQQLSQEGPENEGERTEGETTKRRTLICPTCRAVTPVPPGGVAYMQKNFYLENSDEEESLPAPACDLCDGEQTARYSCTKCRNKVCSQCRRYHDKCCQATGLMEINQKQTRDVSSAKKEQQIQLVEKVVKTLSNKKDNHAQESERIEHKINGDHAAVLHLLNEARDASLKGVKASTEQTVERLGREVDEAKSKLRQLQRRGSGQSASSQDVQVDVLSEADVERYEDVLKHTDKEALLEYKLDDTTMGPLMNSLSDFVRTVAQASSGRMLTSTTERSETPSTDLTSIQQQPALQATEHGSASKFDQLSKEFAEYKKLFAVMQTDNAALHKDNAALHKDNAALHKEMAAVTAKNTSLCTTIATLEKDTWTLKEATKDLAECGKLVKELQTDTQALHRGMTSSTDKNMTLEKDMVALKETSTNTQGDFATLKTNLAAQVSALQTDVRQLLTDKISLNSGMSSLQTDVTQLQSSLASHQTTVASLQTKIGGKASNLVAFHAILTKGFTLRSKKKVIICDKVTTNFGNGYKEKTGIFTAPVTGTYCFFVNTSSNSEDNAKRARLDVVHESKRIGYAYSSEWNWSTGHAVAMVRAGETVFLQSYDDLVLGGAQHLVGCFFNQNSEVLTSSCTDCGTKRAWVYISRQALAAL